MTRIFTTTRDLRFGDCDISGTAYFPSYLNILNGVTEEFWATLGFPWHDIMRTERWGTPTVHLSCDFAQPSFCGDRLRFDLGVIKIGRSSVTLHHRISCENAPRWTGRQVLVASDLDKHCAMPWPAPVLAALNARLTDAEQFGD